VNKKIKIAHLITSLEIGGAQKILYDLIGKLGSTYYEHYVFYFRRGPYVALFKARGISLYEINGFFCLYDFSFFLRLYYALKTVNPHLIHSLLWSANMAARVIGQFINKPLITAYHNNLNQNGLLRNSGEMIAQRLYPSTCLAVSGDVKESLKKYRVKNTPNHIHVINNGVDEQEIARAMQANRYVIDQLCIPKETFVIGTVGRLVAIKRYPLLIKSIALLVPVYPHIHLIIVGSGPEEYRLKELIEQLNLVSAVSLVTGQRAYGYYSLFDCFVQTSDQEGISLALLEALSLSIPCIVASKDFRHPVIIHEYNGFIVEDDNPKTYAHTLLKIILSEDKMIDFRVAGKNTVKDYFNAETMCMQYDQLFRSRVNKL
jgi:glycosyltransferase involved in cell wall biosynthesis